MVQDIKELGSKLNIDISRVCFDVIVLEYRHVDVDQAWPHHGVPAAIAEQVHAGSGNRVALSIKSRLAHAGERSGCNRGTEAAQLEIVSHVARIDWI